MATTEPRDDWAATLRQAAVGAGSTGGETAVAVVVAAAAGAAIAGPLAGAK